MLVEIYIVMNPDGEHVVDHDRECAVERFNGDYSGPYEITQLNIEIPMPKEIARIASAVLADDGSKEFNLVLTEKANEA